jgi:hypothetical protein
VSEQWVAASELDMWAKDPDESNRRPNDDEINVKYGKRELRIVTEMNREQLPNFVEALKRTAWMELRPFYQRRPRWDPARQSKLIESFIMNIPVPPLFVYESDLAKYEVMVRIAGSPALVSTMPEPISPDDYPIQTAPHEADQENP